jgi:acyl carrier protein
MESKFIAIIGYVLELEEQTLELSDRFDAFPEWDSMAQLTLMSELKEKFAFAIEASELRSVETLGELYRRIQAETPKY